MSLIDLLPKSRKSPVIQRRIAALGQSQVEAVAFTEMVTGIGNGTALHRARDMFARLKLVPRQCSTGPDSYLGSDVPPVSVAGRFRVQC